MLTRTADPKQKHVAAFCQSIVNASPVVLPITPTSEAEPLDCFNNVRRHAELHGGRIVFGWAIWEWPGIYIEAEHHAVFEPKGGGEWIDLTPIRVPEISTRLFLPDATADYDFQNEGTRRDNQRRALTNDPLVQQFFDSARRHNDLMNSIPGIGMVPVTQSVAQALQVVEFENAQLTVQLAMKYTPRNAPCFCGSGKKFKRCHGRK